MESNPKLDQMFWDKEHYQGIKDSRVSWRRKATYRKLIKRRLSKMRRRGSNILIRKSTQVLEEGSLENC